MAYIVENESRRVGTETEEIRSFMADSSNSMNCSECPFNRDDRSSLPCGQQNCWVDCASAQRGGGD